MELKFPNVDSNFVHGNEHSKNLETFLYKNKKKFESSLIHDLKHINHRAQNCTGIDIEDIQYQSNNEYILNYKYDWSIYNGCPDMEENDTEYDCISFTIEQNGIIEFDFTILDERTTHEEF